MKHMTNKPPSIFSTKEAAVMAQLLGYEQYGANGFTRDEVRALARLYGIDLDQDENVLVAAGAKRNCFRAAERDGLRCIAILAQYCEEGEDPVRLMSAGLAELGFDIHLDEDPEDECGD